jgi:Zn-dependent peptidase ImmA (M78 family)
MKDQPKTRMIFTFAHELGHIILDHFKETDVLIDELHRDNETFF